MSDRLAAARWLLAVVSLAAAAVHFAVGPEHFAEYAPYGIAFTGLAWFQALTAALLVASLARTRPVAMLAIAVNLGTIGVWALSRTAGLPVGVEPWTPEQVGTADVVALVLEVVLVVGLAALVGRRGETVRPAGPALRALVILGGLAAVLGSAYAIWALAPAPMAM